MQEAEIQFLKEQNELEISKAKELSEIEVCHDSMNMPLNNLLCLFRYLNSLSMSALLGRLHWHALLELDLSQRYS